MPYPRIQSSFGNVHVFPNLWLLRNHELTANEAIAATKAPSRTAQADHGHTAEQRAEAHADIMAAAKE